MLSTLLIFFLLLFLNHFMTQKKSTISSLEVFSLYFFPNGNVLKVVPILALQNESKDARFFDDMRPRVSLFPIVSLLQLPQRNLGIGPKVNVFFLQNILSYQSLPSSVFMLQAIAPCTQGSLLKI